LRVQINISERDLSDARQSILNQLPSVLSSLLFIWKTISEQYIFETSADQTFSTTLPVQSSTNHSWPLYSVKQIRQTILDFLSSLTKSNGMSFISAVAQCWGERKRQQRTQQKTTTTQPVIDAASRSTILTMPRDNAGETQALIDIVMNINGYTLNEMIPNMNELIRNQLTARDKVIGHQERPAERIPFTVMHFSVQFLQLSALYSMKLLHKRSVYLLPAFFQPLGDSIYPLFL
jgi:hypothetical protein